jgi:hydroxymethylpyrimidine/phosphomethylpyrimidine kinase
MKRSSLPIALTIAGSDSGGGAGVQADLKTFAALDVHGTSVITCLTAQNPKGVRGVQAATPTMVRQQLEAVFAVLPSGACKTGMLYSRQIIRTVAKFFSRAGRPRLIVDPVMVATSGARLLERGAIRAVREELLPLAALATPNLDEAELLLGMKIRNEEDLRTAARKIVQQFGCAALVKGGHLRGTQEAMDIFYDGKTELMLAAPFVRGVSTHGTGCTYSAAVAAFSARGSSLAASVAAAKGFITGAIAHSRPLGQHFVLDWFHGSPGSRHARVASLKSAR